MHLEGKGLSEFLSDYNATPESYIQDTSLNPNLKVIHSGPIAPNPNELLESDKFLHLLDTAKDF
jgi:Mrp family chromosome partitioning ATPase